MDEPRHGHKRDVEKLKSTSFQEFLLFLPVRATTVKRWTQLLANILTPPFSKLGAQYPRLTRKKTNSAEIA